MSDTFKKFWITKRWSTKGILEETCKVVPASGGGEESYASNPTKYIFVRIGTDAFDTPEAAAARAVDCAERKLKALKKQIAKIEKLRDKLRIAKAQEDQKE